jgi:hypothetical protein
VVLNLFVFAMLPPDMARIAIRVFEQCQKHGASLAPPPPKNVGRLIYEYVDREKSCVFFMLTT